MVESIKIIDFQAHKKLKIKLDPYITCVVGPTDSGKSSIIRAIKWLATNKPTGDAFIRSGADGTKIILRVDGRDIRRTKGKQVNTYHLDGRKFEAFRADVPDEIQKILNLSEDNFQSQHDSPFWFSSSAGEVSRQLNSIINLGEIDSTLGYLNSVIRESGATISVCRERLQSARDQREELADAKQMDWDLTQVEDKNAKLTATSAKRTQIDETIKAISAYHQTTNHAANVAMVGKSVVDLGDGWAKLRQKRDRLSSLIQTTGGMERTARRVIPDLSGVEMIEKKLDRVEKSMGALRKLIDAADGLSGEVERTKQAARQLQKRFDKEMGDRCALCGAKL